VVILLAAYLSFFERKILAYIADPHWPQRVGPRGWLQPIADALKLFVKEDILSISRREVRLHARSSAGHRPGARGVLGDPVRDRV